MAMTMFPPCITADEWYERAKKATDRCDLELTKQWKGADKGLDDKVRRCCWPLRFRTSV